MAAALNSSAQVRFTVVPCGASAGPGVAGFTLHLCALASPVLSAINAADTNMRTPLAGTPFANWPDTLAGFTFTVHFGNGLTANVTPKPQAEPQLWRRFFGGVDAKLGGPSTAPFASTLASRMGDMKKFAYNGAHQHLMEVYQKAAAESSATVVRMPAGDPSSAMQGTAPPLASARAMKVLFGKDAALRATHNQALDSAADFYHRKHEEGVVEPPLPPTDPNFEFHQWLSLTAQYPWLQRRLGLLLDFELTLPAGASPADGSTNFGTIWLASQSSPSSSFAVGSILRTHFVFDRNPLRFDALYANPTSLPLGCLPLGDETSYSLSQVSVDGAALRVQGFARELDAMSEEKLNDPTTAPALHGGPLTVARANLANHLQERVQRAKTLHEAAEQTQPVDLFAEDLIKGFRVDVFFNNRWFKLCQRTCTLQLDDVHPGQHPGPQSIQIPPDEGWLTLAPTQQEDQMFLHDAIFAWSGWNLVAPKPGSTMGENGNVVDWKFPLVGRPRIMVKEGPLKLPAYRYGRKYKFRARTVDLAGNSPTLPNVIPDSVITSTHSGQRFEPVGAPFVVPLSTFEGSPGESATILVIRTEEASDRFRPTVRHIAPPPINHILAEQHGLFDVHGAPDPSKYEALVAAATPPAFAKDLNWFEPSPKFRVPYTPDPLCAGVVFFGLPGSAAPFPIAKQGLQPFLLRLVSGAAEIPPHWDEPGNVLTVTLIEGHTAHVHVASLPDSSKLDLLGMWSWMQAGDDPPSVATAAQGLLWPLTPTRSLTLIHAVPRPLRRPLLTLSTANPAPRSINDTFVDLNGTIKLDVPSTGELQITGAYEEWLDDPDTPARLRQRGQSLALAMTPLLETLTSPIEFGERMPPQNRVATVVRQHFPDTHYRRVAYSVTAVSRYKEQFAFSKAQPELTIRQTPDGTPHGHHDHPTDERAWLDIENTARPAVPEVARIVPLYGWHPRVETEPATGEPSGSRAVQRKMQGGGIRIYLERGWYSSGDQEQLAVLLWPGASDWLAAGHNEFPADVRPFASQWGMDPIWQSKPLTKLLAREHFLNANPPLVPERMFTLPHFEPPPGADGLDTPYPANRLMEVVAFNPFWDKQRALWYCDIHMDDTQAYSPFVRLALARFQPISVQLLSPSNKLVRDVHLSAAIRADFVQLPSGRIVTIVEDRSKKNLKITVTGLTYTATAGGPGASTIEAAFEKRDERHPLGWVPVPGQTVTLTRAMQQDGNTGTWDGVLVLGHHARHHKCRVAIHESVELPSSDGGKAKRLLYADGIEL